MFARLVCRLKGHNWVPHDVVPGYYCKLTVDTCSRCGAGEGLLRLAQSQYLKFRKGI